MKIPAYRAPKNQIVGIKISETEIGPFSGPPMVFAILNDGDEIPLFPFQEKNINYEPAEFIGLTPDGALSLKRVKDLIWYGRILF